ncbi:MAG: helix-turn-helix domain-containing protein [Elusimicrobiota bacterium]|jgi:excisionase family DNA binding protein
MDKRLLTVKEAAVYLALSPITLYHLVYRREIPFVKLRAKALRFDKQDLDKLVDNLKSKTVKDAEKDGTLQARQDMVAGVLP